MCNKTAGICFACIVLYYIAGRIASIAQKHTH